MGPWCLLTLILSASVLVSCQTVVNPDAEVIPDPHEDVLGPLMPQDGQDEPRGPAGGASSNASDYEPNAEPSDDSCGDDYDPMLSDTAPLDSDQEGGWCSPYTITEQRLKEIRRFFMYPFYDKGGNADNEGDYQKGIQYSTTQVNKDLNFQLPFFGFRFNYTRVSVNGYLEFSDPPPNYEYPLVFPVKEWPQKNDPSFIGIFYSKCRIGDLRDGDIDRRKPGVYFRMERDLRERTDRLGVEIRERLKWDIREGVVGSDTFDPKHAIIVTWKNVSFDGGFGSAIYRTNTFQMVLATDEVFTYAMFNYLNLNWTTHPEAGGDTLVGEGGVPAFVGFNGGNGTRSFEYKPYSQASVIRDLTSKGFANGFPGRHYFRIDENILTGTCNNDLDGANLPLMFAPESGNMLGGTVVNITGPCFEPTDQILCKFGTDIVYGVVVSRTRAICVQPQIFVEGYIRFEIAIGPNAYKWKGRYYVESPAMATQKIFFKDMSVHNQTPAEVGFIWERQNLTTNENAIISISLWGYSEATTIPSFLYITDIVENVQNTGEYTIVPSQFKDREDDLSYLKFGFIQINLTETVQFDPPTSDTNVKITKVIWSRPIPLSWYFHWQWERMYGSKWASYLCDDWIASDRYLKNFTQDLPQCPCTLDQALMDKGRFTPDLDCDRDSNPSCYYNQQAVHCVKTGSPTYEGSEQQCCYDKYWRLMSSYDQQWGSSPRRSHNLGLTPYDEATKVPTLSQWWNDIAPKYTCCLWQEEEAAGCETLRFERRPTPDCVAYQPPGVASVYGDSNVTNISTFDGLEYTFNGKGEFVLVESKSDSDNLEVKATFEEIDQDPYVEVRAAQLTSITARGNSFTVVEVRRRPSDARWRYRLDVLVDYRRVYFDRPSLKFQHYPGVTVYTPTLIFNQSEVIVMFDNGAGVEVLDNGGYMTARVYLPVSFINKTSGLFGNWTVIKEDEY